MAAGLASRTLFTCGFSVVACLSSVQRFTIRSLQGSSSVIVTPFLQLRRGGSRDFRGFSSSRQPDFNNRRSVRAMATMPTNAPIEAAANNPGLCDTPDDATKTYFVQQTMYRIKDPKASLEFYSKVLGMTLLRRFDFPDAKFSLYFLGYEDPATIPTDGVERTAFLFNCKATLELTHNWGTEKDSNFKGYHNGNSDPRGYGHIGITVDDVYKACDRFEKLGVAFAKRPDDGVMKGLAFIKDPDGYWIEIFEVALITKTI